MGQPPANTKFDQLELMWKGKCKGADFTGNNSVAFKRKKVAGGEGNHKLLPYKT